MRNIAGHPVKSISELEITGEGLHIVGFHQDGRYLSKRYRVIEQDGKKRIGDELGDERETLSNFLVPLARVWGVGAT